MSVKRLILLSSLLGALVSPFVLAQEPQPQLETACIRIERKAFKVEIAKTAEQQQRGMQFRKSLAANKGMIFPYPSARTRTFWMKDCKIALDILYFNQGQLVDYVDSAPPCQLSAEQCPVYRSKAPADLVVELKAGTRQKLGFKKLSPLTVCK